MNIKLPVFIKGELINLCAPTREYALHSDWYSWFNHKATTKYMEQGIFPNTPEQQAEFFDSLKDKKRLCLIIQRQSDFEYIGVVSLSHLNFEKKFGSLAIVISKEKEKIGTKGAPLIPLEAIARISEWGFVEMGLERIFAGQHTGLSGWQNRMEIFGYRLEGVFRAGFVKGIEIADSVIIACLRKDYQAICQIRGSYWPGADEVMRRIKALPKPCFAKKLGEFLNTEGEAYYKDIFK